MFKYIKELFRDVVYQSIVGLNGNNSGQIISPEIMENELNDSSMMRINNTVHSDPREIPRPLRMKRSLFCNRGKKMCTDVKRKIDNCDRNDTVNDVAVAGNINIKKGKKTMEIEGKDFQKKTEEICICENCSIVGNISECGVCFESLQSRSVRSCQLCANLVCSDCAVKLNKCAYCRTFIPNQRNRAIERLLGKLSLPCKNARSGCKKLLKSEERFRHEVCCDHASMSCPIANGACSWQGSPVAILNHLRQVHALRPLADNGIAVQISNFRQKALAKEGEYTIYLTCYSQLFAVKVILLRRKLILTFSQLGFVSPVTDEDIISSRYGVWIKVNGGTKQIRGILPFGRSNHVTQEIEINSGKLFSKTPEKSNNGVDCVKIKISIREI